MKKAMIIIITQVAIYANGVEIPLPVLKAIVHAEGGRTGKATKEPNGRYSYGVYQLSKAFLTDVNKYHKTTFTVDGVRDNPGIAALACSLGLTMIMEKRKCDLKTALAVYNGGWKNRNNKVCKAYADKVLRLAEKENKK